MNLTEQLTKRTNSVLHLGKHVPEGTKEDENLHNIMHNFSVGNIKIKNVFF